MAAFGADIDGALACADDEDTFEVWPDNWAAVQVFVACQTQWRWVGGMAAMRTGLDYTAVITTAGVLDVGDTAAVFDGVRILEAAALHEWARAKR